MDARTSRMESPLLEKLRALEDPRPHLNEAKDSLERMVSLQRDLFLLDVELRTLDQIKRFAYGIAAILSLELMFALGLGWISWGLYQRGWSPWVLSLCSFLVFGGVTFVFARLARDVGVKREEE
jgi:hypothetical protein